MMCSVTLITSFICFRIPNTVIIWINKNLTFYFKIGFWFCKTAKRIIVIFQSFSGNSIIFWGLISNLEI